MPSDLEDLFIEAAGEDSDPDGESSFDNSDSVVDTGLGTETDFSDEADTGEPDDAEDFTDNPADGPDGTEDLFDWEAYADRKVAIKVQGQDELVPLKELRDGYMRREDYSRKTAETAGERAAAEWARDVQASFESDPAGTLQAFARAYLGADIPTQQAPQVDPYADFEPEVAAILRAQDEKIAKQEATLNQITRQVDYTSQKSVMDEVQREMAGLKSLHGDLIDELEVLETAAANNVTLSFAADYLIGRMTVAERLAKQDAGKIASKVADERDTVKRQQGKKAVSGSLKSTFDVETIPADSFNTISELFALQQNAGRT